MTVPNRWRPFVEFTAEHCGDRGLAERAKGLIASDKAHARRVSVKKAPGRAEVKAKGQTRRQRMADIRAKVMERNGHLCELCFKPASEAHHVLSGPLRRVRESVDTMLCLCAACHRALHGSDLDVLERALNYCLSSGMPAAAGSLRHRIDKIMEARQ